MHGNDALTFADVLSLIRRRFGIVLLAGVLGAVAGAAYLVRAHPVYESTARLVLDPVSESPDVPAAMGGGTGAVTLTATQKSILRSDEVTGRAAEQLGDGTTATALRDASSVEVVPDSLTLDVTCTGTDPAQGQARAQALVESYLEVRADQEGSRKSSKVDSLTEQRGSLDKAIETTSAQLKKIDPQANPATETVLAARLNAQLAQQGTVQAELSSWQSLDTTAGHVVTPATRPENSNGPGIPVVLIGAVAAAMVIGFAVALVYDSADPNLRNAQDLEQVARSTPVNVIADPDGGDRAVRKWFARAFNGHVPEALGQADGPEAESYRRLALRLGGWPGPRPRYLLVTSVGTDLAEEVAVNLSVALGREGTRVLLVWSNPRGDTLDAYFSVPPGPGLGEVLAESVKLEDAVLEIPGCQGLSLLPVGSRKEAREELFRFSVLKEALADPDRVHFDQVVLIAASSADYADALTLASQVDGVLVAAELGSTGRDALTATLEGLRSVDAHLDGVVAL